MNANQHFEAWVLLSGHPENSLEHDHIGAYYDEKISAMWMAFKAAFQLATTGAETQSQPVAWCLYTEIYGEMVLQDAMYFDKSNAEECAKLYGQSKTEVRPLYAAPQAADTDKVREASAWEALRADVLHGVDGLDNDQVNTVLGMIDYYTPTASMAAQAPVREVPGWISVDERYPELTIRDENKVVIENRSIPPMTSSEKVIVCLDDGNRRIDRAVRLDGSEYTFFQSYGARVKYWQSLPAAPVQQEGA